MSHFKQKLPHNAIVYKHNTVNKQKRNTRKLLEKNNKRKSSGPKEVS